MKVRVLIAAFLVAGLLFSSGPVLARAAKMCVVAVDELGKPIEGAEVEVTHEKGLTTATTGADGKCCVMIPGQTCAIEIKKGGYKERLAPVGVLDGLTVIITLHPKK